MTDLVPVKESGMSIFSSTPTETVKYATEIANALAPLIEKQGMFAVIQGKKYVKVESWLTMGAMLGILPREADVKELPDGSYEASVELINGQGRVVGGASAICGIEEKRWGNADRYARRSMAVTRATAKSYRLAFSWILGLAGYEPTPYEEMADFASPQTREPPKKKTPGYDPTNEKHNDYLRKELEKRNIATELQDMVAVKLKGRSFTEIGAAISEVLEQ